MLLVRGKHRCALLVGSAVVLVIASVAYAGNVSKEINGIRIELTSTPSEPGTKGTTEYTARLTDRDGMPVTGAQVALGGRMADGMTVVAPLSGTREAGLYRGRVLFTMEGRWELTLRVIREGKRVELPLTEHVVR